MAETAIDNARAIADKLRALHGEPGLWLVANALTALIQHVEGLEQLLEAHKADKSPFVHRFTPEEHEAAIVAKVDGYASKITNPRRFVGQHPPQFYLMPGATGDPHTDRVNYEQAVWNAYQRRKWTAETGEAICGRCSQGVNHHMAWCDEAKKQDRAVADVYDAEEQRWLPDKVLKDPCRRCDRPRGEHAAVGALNDEHWCPDGQGGFSATQMYQRST